MQSDEDRNARMRAYYQKNKHKWKGYKENKLAVRTEEQEEQDKIRRREYHREYYQKHRRKIIDRTRKYQATRQPNFAEYRAKYFQENKPAIHAKRRKHYHQVVKPRSQKAKQCSEFVPISEAVRILNAKLRPFREWVYRGSISSVRTPGGRHLLRRSDVLELKANIHHLPIAILTTLGLKKNEE